MSSKNYKYLLLTTTALLFSGVPFAAASQDAQNTASIAGASGTSDPLLANNTASDVDTILASIAAAPDMAGPINGSDGGDDVVNAFDNDRLNGAPIDPADITANVTIPASPVSPGDPVPVLDPATGLVDVPAGTPAGSYTITYEICENSNPTNCASAAISVIVEAPPIIAEDETLPPVNSGTGGDDIANLLDNDRLNGDPIDPALVTLTITNPPSDPGIVIDPASGLVSVSTDVPPGTYSFTYQICENLNPSNCDTAVATIEVEAQNGAISGKVFNDDNVNDVQDPDDQPRQGFLIEVVRDGAVIATGSTDADGSYLIEDLLAVGGYSIVFTDPATGTVYEIIDNITVTAGDTLENVDLPIDPSGVIYDSVTRQAISGAQITLVDSNRVTLPDECFIDPSQASQITGVLGEYQFDLVPGAAPQCPVGETVYRLDITPPSGFFSPSSVIAPQDGPFDPTGLAGPVLINPENGPPLGPNPPYYLSFALESGDPDVIFNHIPLDPFLNRDPLIVVKTSPKRTANIGDIVPYEITVQNQEAFQRNDVDVVDVLPAGMRYIRGSGFVGGVAQEPETDNAGRELVWRDQVIPANGSVTYSLSMVIGAGVTRGEKINTGLAEDGGTGDPISNRGTAVVQIVPSSVFDCSELIGKVFEDANYNGYQDEGEPGVPGVRLATVNGQLVTTDEFGRYHIACAAVPNARMGANYILKLDPRSLPLGWDTTTGNPRSIRLTRGKFGELNFGVAPADDRVVGAGSPKTRTDGGE